MINVEKLANRLREFEEGKKASDFAKLLWKPKEGLQTVRIIPYKFNPEVPFIELKFYYGLAGANYLAPSTFGKPDPIQELIDNLRASGSNEEKEIAKKLSPTSRTYVPVIVRGEEELGVRYWGFGVQVYKQLLKLMTNSKWGDITSLTEGNDIDVEFKKVSAKKNVKTGQAFPETIITPCPQKTTAVDTNRKDLMAKLADQTDINQIFPLKSYDELKAVVDKWLHPEDADSTPESAPDAGVTESPVTATARETAPAAAPVSKADEFAKFFAK